MALDGLAAQEQAAGDGRVGPTLGHEPQYLPLAFGELVERARVGVAGEERGDDVRVDDGSAAGDAADRVEEVVEVGDAVLEQVAQPGSALAEQVQRPSGVH